MKEREHWKTDCKTEWERDSICHKRTNAKTGERKKRMYVRLEMLQYFAERPITVQRTLK